MATRHPSPGWRRRDWLRTATVTTAGWTLGPARASDDFWALARQGGHVLLMRHARTEPGIGDPPEFRLGDCRTQRNLSEAGRDEARRVGERFLAEGVRLDAVYSSAWCRCTDTAALAFDPHHPPHRVWEALNSFFQGRDDGERQTQATLQRLRTLRPPANWMLVTHQVNITALTGEWPAMGELFLTRPPQAGDTRLAVRARWRP